VTTAVAETRWSLMRRLVAGGPAGNEHLTPATGVVLRVLVGVLGVTILRIGQLLNVRIGYPELPTRCVAYREHGLCSTPQVGMPTRWRGPTSLPVRDRAAWRRSYALASVSVQEKWIGPSDRGGIAR
jgi:hypothetical protein